MIGRIKQRLHAT